MGWQEDLYAALMPVIDIPENYPQKRPLLAHYTSMPVLEAIASHGEIWMSHPLMMNDTQELMGGLDAARAVLLNNVSLLEALGDQAINFSQWYTIFEGQFLSDDAFDTYLFCLSEHDPNDLDGALSMWRGYGGNGGGAAIVFATGSLMEVERTPFILGKVNYVSALEQNSILIQLAETAAKMLATEPVTSTNASAAAHQLFQFALRAALFTKHHGFREEKEWRLVYMKDIDPNLSDRRFHVHLGLRGPEPKLKLPIASDPLLSGAPISFDTLIDRILLGPTASSRLAKFAIQRLLLSHDRTRLLSQRVSASTTPYRVFS